MCYQINKCFLLKDGDADNLLRNSTHRLKESGGDLCPDVQNLSARNLKCSVRLLVEGVKLMAKGRYHYEKMVEKMYPSYSSSTTATISGYNFIVMLRA